MSPDARDIGAPIAYLAAGTGPAEHRIYPLSSGRRLVRPEHEFHPVQIRDCRGMSPAPTVEQHGFELLTQPSAVPDLWDNDAIRADYYTEVRDLLRGRLNAEEVLVFDHNQRSAARAATGQSGVRTPVQAAHVDYTPTSGPRRAAEILRAAGREELLGRHLALVNVWRPIRGPVEDMPLAVCDPRSTAPADFARTLIHHFGENDLENPSHSGEIYSVRHNVAHRWYYASAMQPSEVLLLLNWDSRDEAHRCFTPHTGFALSATPLGAEPRESIEARTLVIYPEAC